MTVRTRFAPSPTGFLHIGGARTALFNALFARHHGGQFLLRIEDTDRERSTEEAVAAIFQGLAWLGLNPDEPPLFQFSRAQRHKQIAEQMVRLGQAYYCYTTPQELEVLRAQALAEKRPFRYPGTWRDRDPAEAPAGIKPVVRLRAPTEGSTIVHDLAQGPVEVLNSQLDDMVLLRSDGTPTYMLAVVVDDHDMGITHVIRGDDHLTNTFRQKQIYEAMNWQAPQFAHIPLIHGSDGAKLSKRHGALGVEAYKEMGFLPETIVNYLMRLGWSHGDQEIFSFEEAARVFDLAHIGRSPSRLDFDKMHALNAHYIQTLPEERLVKELLPLWENGLGHSPTEEDLRTLRRALPFARLRAKTLQDLENATLIYLVPPQSIVLSASPHIAPLIEVLKSLKEWTADALKAAFDQFLKDQGLIMKDLGPILRKMLVGAVPSPSIHEILDLLGHKEALLRLEKNQNEHKEE